MKDYNFIIKVSDFLREPSTKDTISFEKKFSTHISQLSEKGINATIEIQGLSDEQVSLYVVECTCEKEIVCDYCGGKFYKKLMIEGVQKRVSLEGLDGDDDDNLYIDKKNETIDVEHFLTTLLVLSDDVVNKCTNCENNIHENEEETVETTNIIRK